MKTSEIIGCLILQPANFSNDLCPVDDISENIKQLDIDGYIKIFIGGEAANFMQEFDAQSNGQKLPNRIVLISHGNKKNNSFISKKGYKDASWWNVKETKDFMLAHSCFSAHILSHKSWHNKFKDWIGNSDKVWYSINNVSTKIWPYFFRNLCVRLGEIKSGEEMKKSMARIYWTSVYEAVNINDPIQSYRIALNRNLSVLTHKTEFGKLPKS